MKEPKLPTNPTQTDFSIGREYEIGELSRWEYDFSDYKLEIVVSGTEDAPRVDVKATGGDYWEVFWTAVYWCYEYNIPGVCQEHIVFIHGEEEIKYRLGALYRYAEFGLTERETDYFTYGENPKTA